MWIKQSGISIAARFNACIVCGGTKGPALGTGVDIEFEGAVEVCHTCITEAGQLIGMSPASEVEALRDELLELRVWADNAYEQLQALSALRDAVVSAVPAEVGA
jgi:recombinational DNA repair protein (RecF pathway)